MAASEATATEIRPPLGAAADPVASLDAMACTSARSCAAGGAYDSRVGQRLALVVTESGGHWFRARTLQMPANAVPAPFVGS